MQKSNDQNLQEGDGNSSIPINPKTIKMFKDHNRLLQFIVDEKDAHELLYLIVEDMVEYLNFDGGKVFSSQKQEEEFNFHVNYGHGFENLASESEVKNLEPFGKMKSIWSFPLLKREGGERGTLCLFSREVRRSNDEEDEVIKAGIFLINLVIDREIAKRERDEEKLKIATTGKMAVLGELAGGIAHEINNPLAIISSQAQKIKMLDGLGKLKRDKLEESVEKILNTVDRIGRITRAMRICSRDEQSQAHSYEDICLIIEDTMTLCSEKIKYSGVTLTWDFPAEHPTIHCNLIQISQVIANIISNAFDAIVEQEEAWIHIEVKNSDGWGVVIITDSGKGISKEIEDKIMQPFFTTKRVGHGTGIGLSLSKDIIDNHGGVLEYNRDCENTQFVIKIPISCEEKSLETDSRLKAA